jgi:hypothetical protein
VDDFIEPSRGFGDRLPAFRPTLNLYLTFDGPAFGRDPTADILMVSELVLKGPESVSAEALFSQTGWDARRFNPTIAYVASQIPDGRVSKSSGTRFAVHSFHMLPEDRVRIKRHAGRLTA